MKIDNSLVTFAFWYIFVWAVLLLIFISSVPMKGSNVWRYRK